MQRWGSAGCCPWPTCPSQHVWCDNYCQSGSLFCLAQATSRSQACQLAHCPWAPKLYKISPGPHCRSFFIFITSPCAYIQNHLPLKLLPILHDRVEVGPRPLVVLQHVALQADREKTTDMERSATAFVWPVTAPLSACPPAHILKHREAESADVTDTPRACGAADQDSRPLD